jgi:hypothetical protein
MSSEEECGSSVAVEDDDVEMRDTTAIGGDRESHPEVGGTERRGILRPLKKVQEDYQRITQMRQRGASSVSQAAFTGADGSLSNPGTEVTINCVMPSIAPLLSFCIGIRSGQPLGRIVQKRSQLKRIKWPSSAELGHIIDSIKTR